MTSLLQPLPELPPGWTARPPVPDDVEGVLALAVACQESVRGSSTSVTEDAVRTALVGTASWTRRQLLVAARDGSVTAWCTVHDRAAGRTGVELLVAPRCPEGDRLAPALLDWSREAAAEVARHRGLAATQLDATPDADDHRLQGWLAAAGYRRTRTWLQMTRPVDDAATLPAPRPGVTVRPVGAHEAGMPVAADLQVVHRMLEESFADHFNSYRESFPEFVQRLREDPGHRWDHWWIAEVETDGQQVPGGALVGSVLPPDASGAEGSYVDYIGVHRSARGRGVAKALLATVIRDAHDRGRNRVGLEVDADSPTGADGLYRSLGWETAYAKESWHAELVL